MSTETKHVLHQQAIVAGDTWSFVLKRGQELALSDPSGLGNCVMLAFHQRNLSERYNMPDTLKGQHTAHLTTGHCLYSDMGRVLLSVVDDDFGFHDPFGAISDEKSSAEKYGVKPYQEFRNDWIRNSRDNLLIELGKYGLDERDWHAPINWFSSVIVEESGQFSFDTSRRHPGQSVTLRADLDTLLLLSATPHRFDPNTEWQAHGLEARIMQSAPTQKDDVCWQHCSENGRAFELTELAALAY